MDLHHNDSVTVLRIFTDTQFRRASLVLAAAVLWAGFIRAHAAEGRMFPKGEKLTSLVVVDMGGLNRAERVMVSTLQGVLAKSSSRQIFMEERGGPPWAHFLAQHYGVTVTTAADPWNLIAKFATNVDGYILYDYATNRDSVNVATSLCGLYKAIAIDASIEGPVRAAGITRLIKDVRNRSEEWVYDNYRSRLNSMVGAELNDKIGYHLRDYAVMANAFVFSDRGQLRQRILEDWPTGGVLMGYPDVSAKGEYGSFVGYSKRGIYYLGADMAANLSLLSSVYDPHLHQKSHPPVPVTETNVHYVTFLMSDGDNAAFDLWSLYFQYNNPVRGNFSMGWPMLPSMVDYAPSVLRWYYENASAAEGKRDDFIAAGGITGAYLNAWPTNDLPKLAQRLNHYMKRADMRVLLTIGYGGFNRLDVWRNFTAQPNIDGIFYVNYGGPNTGQVVFSHGKPIVEIRDVLWKGQENEAALAKRINAASRDPRRAEGYTAVLVHAWTMNLGNVQRAIAMFAPDVRVVTPEEFIALLRKNAAPQAPETKR